jgi:hypothetical protein
MPPTRPYTYTQTRTEMHIDVPVDQPFDFKRDVVFRVKAGRSIFLQVGGRIIMDGVLHAAVDQEAADTCACTVRKEGGSAVALAVELEKQQPMPWPCCIAGEDDDERAGDAPAAEAGPAPSSGGQQQQPPPQQQQQQQQQITATLTEAGKARPNLPPRPARPEGREQEGLLGAPAPVCVACVALAALLAAGLGWAGQRWGEHRL